MTRHVYSDRSTASTSSRASSILSPAAASIARSGFLGFPPYPLRRSSANLGPLMPPLMMTQSAREHTSCCFCSEANVEAEIESDERAA